MSENEKKQQRGEQLGTLEEIRREEYEQTEEQDNKIHDILEVMESSPQMAKTGDPKLKIEEEDTTKDNITVEQQIEVISNQQASIKESQHSIEKKNKGSDTDEIEGIMEDKSTDLSSKEVHNEATIDQNSEPAAHDLTVYSYNKDSQSINACTKDENVGNSSTSDAIHYQEEFGEERSFTGVMNDEADKSFDLVGEEKGPEAIGSSRKMGIEKDEKDNITDNSIENDSIPNVAASQEMQNNEEATLKTKDIANENLEMESVTGSSEKEVQIEEEEKHKEAPTNVCNIKIQDTTGSNEQEKDEAPVDNETHDENITGLRKQEAGVEEEEKHKEAPTTARHVTIQDITESEEPENAQDHKELESTKLGGHPESSLLQQNEPEKNKLELDAIVEQLETAPLEDDAVTTTCIKEESNGPKITGKDFTEEQDNERDAEKLKDEESSAKIKKEGSVNELSPEYIQEDSTATLKDEAEKSKIEIVKESVTAGAGERITCETNENETHKNDERSVDISSMKQDEGQEEEARDLSPMKASIEEDTVDTYSGKLAKDNEHNIVETTEKMVKVESKDEEDSEKALLKHEPGEKLENLLHVMSEETLTEPSSENASSITCMKSKGTIQDLEETPETEKKEEKTKDMDHTDGTVKEEFAGLDTAPLSTKAGKQNLEEQAISEHYSALTGKETVEDSSKGDENNATNLKEEDEDKYSELKEQNEEADLTEEKKSEDSSESKTDNYATATTEPLEEEILAEQSKITLLQNSSSVSENHEKVIEVEIQDKGAIILDSDSVPARILSEEIGLKEAEPENKEQVVCSDIELEEKGLASNVDFEVQQEQKSNTEANEEEKSAIALASESGKQVGQEMEDKTPAPSSKNEEKKTTSETFLDDIPEDNPQDSSVVPSIENEAITTEASHQSEKTPAKDETPHEDAKTPFTEPTDEDIQLLNKDESFQKHGLSKLESYDIVKETENEEIQRQRDQQLHMPHDQINDTNGSESGDVGISKKEEAIDFACKNEVSNLEILKEEKLSVEVSSSNAAHTCMDSEKAILEDNGSDNNSEGSFKSEVKTTVESEANTNENSELSTIKVFETTAGQETRKSDSIKDYSPEFSIKEPEGSTKEDEAIVGMQTIPASSKIGKEDLEEQDISEISSSLLGGETIKEILKDDKNAVMNLEEERKSTHLDSKEQLEATDLREETKYQIIEENIESNNDLCATRTDEILGQDSSFLSNVSEEVIEEEIQEKESTVYNSNSGSVGIVSEETGLKKGELEDKEQVKGLTIEPEENGSAISATLDVKPEENSSTVENREEILTAPYDGGEKMMETETEVTRETSSYDMPGDYLLKTEAMERLDHVTKLPEETKCETLVDSAEPNKDLYATITTEALDREKLAEQSNKNFVQNSSSVAEVSEKVFEDTIQDKTTIICNSNSVSAGILIEDTCLNEAEPENEKQVRNFDIALKEKGLASRADIEIQQEKISNPEENGEKQIPADTDRSGDEIGHEMEDETSIRIESAEKNTTSEKLLDNIPEDNLQDSYTVSSIVNESMTTEASDRSEETPPRDENLHEDVKTPTIDPLQEALQLLKEDESILPDDVSKLESYDIVKGIGNEETQKRRDQQLHKPHEHINDVSSSESGGVVISKVEEATDTAYETEVSNLEILKDEKLSIEDSTNIAVGTCMDSEKAILEHEESDNCEGSLKGEVKTAVEVETNTNKNDEILAKKVSETTYADQETREMDSIKDYSPELANKEQPEGNIKDDKILVGITTSPSSTKIGKQDSREQENSEISSSLLGGETAEEIVNDDKNAQMDLKEEKRDAHSYSKEQLDVNLEKNLEPYKDLYDMRTIEATNEETRAEECNAILGQDSSFVSEVSEKPIEEEIQETQPTAYSSNSLSAGTVIEKTGLKKGEPEDSEQVKSCTIAPEEKGFASNAMIDVKPEEKSKEENREEILTAANDGRGKTEDKIEESIDTAAEEEKKIATSKTSAHGRLEVDLSTTEAIITLDETPAGNKVTDLTEETKDEILEDNAGSDKELYATTTTEALEEDKTADQSRKIVVQNSSIVAEVSDSARLVIEETDLKEVEEENKEQIQSSDISLGEKGLASIVDIEIPQEKNSNFEENDEKEIPEVVNESGEKIEHKMGTGKNFEAGLSGAEVVKEAAELKAKNTKSNEQQREEMIAYASESVTQDQIEDTLPLTKKSHTESEPVEQQVVAQKFHGALEIQMETEPRMKADDQISKIDCTNGTITEEHEEIEKAEKSENTEVQVIDGESNLTNYPVDERIYEEHEEIEKAEKCENTEVQVIDGESNLKNHPVDERIYEEKKSSAVFGEYIKEQDSNEPTPSMNSQSEEDITKKRETSVTKAPDEEKIQDEESTKPVDVCNAVAEKGKYEEEIKEDCATVTRTATATNFDDAQLVDKPVEEETKTALDVKHIDETRPALTNGTEKEVDEHCKTVSPSEFQSITVITKDEILNDQALPTGASDEQLHAKPSTSFAEEQEHETTTAIKELEKQCTKEVDEHDNEDVEDSSTAHLLKEEHRELKVSELAVESLGTNETEKDTKTALETVSESGFQSIEAASRDEVVNDTTVPNEPAHGTVPTIKTRDEENKKEVDLLDNEDSSAAHLRKEEHGELKVSELAVEGPGTNETLSESDFQRIEPASQDEIVDDKIVPDVISKTSKEACIEKEEPKEHKISDVIEEIPGASETEEEIKDASKTVSTSNSEQSEVVTDEKIITDQTFPEEISKEQLQVPSSTLLPREQEDETTTSTNRVEADDTKEVEILGNENIVDYSSPKTTEDISLEKGGHRELKVSELTVAMLSADEIEEKINESVTVSENNSSNIEVLTVDKDETSTDQALPAELSPEKLQLPLSTLLPKEQELRVSELAVEKPGSNETVSESDIQNIEAASQDEIVNNKIVPAVISKTSKEACIEKEEPKELKISDVIEDIPGSDETEEEIKDASKTVSTSNSEQSEVVTDENIITNQTFPEEISKEQLQVPSSTLLPRKQEDETTATTNKVEEDDTKEVEILGSENGVDYSSPKTAEDISLEKDEHRELKVSELTVAMLGADEIEEKINESVTVSENNSSNIEVLTVDKDETSTDQALPAELSPEKLQLPLSTLLPKEQELRVSELAVEKPGSNETVSESDIQNIEAASQDEIVNNKIVPAVISKTSKEACIEKEEPKELKISDVIEDIPGSDETEEEIKDASKTVSTSNSEQSEVVTDENIITNQTFPEEISKEQLQVPSSTLLPRKQEDETTATTNKVEEDDTKEVEILGSENGVDYSSPKTAEDISLEKDGHRELKVSELTVAMLGADEIEEKINESVTVSENNSSNIEVLTVDKDETITDQALPAELSPEKLQLPLSTLLPYEQELNVSELAVEKPGSNETVSESDIQSIEAASQDEIVNNKIVPAVISKTSKEACIEKEEPKELKISDVIEDIPGSDETEEEIKDASKTVSKSNSERSEVVTDENIITDQTFPEEISKEQLQVPSSILLPREHEDETSATTNKVEEDDTKEVEILGNENGVDYSSPKTAEDISLEKDGHRALKVSELTVAMLGDEIEKKFNGFDTVSENNASNIEVLKVDKDETIIDQALPAEPSPEKPQLPLSTLLPNEQEHDTTTTIEKTEVVTETSNRNIDAGEITSDFVSEKAQNHGEFTKTEDKETKNNNVEVAKTDLRTEENRSEMTNEANKTVKNEISDEEIKEDKPITDDSQPISLGEDNFQIVSNSEHPGEKMEGTFKTSTNGIQPELSEVDEKRNASGNIEKLITDEASGVKDLEQLSKKDKTIEENSPDEAAGKNVKEEAKNLDHENQRDETNFKNITTDVASTREKESLEISTEESILGLKSHATMEKESSREEVHNESTPTRITTGNKDAPPMLPDPIEETTHRAEPKETKAQKDMWVDTEIKGEEREVEKETGESGEKTSETASPKVSLSDFIQSSTKNTKQVTEEKEPRIEKEVEAEHGEEKIDDEEGEEHKGSEPEGEAPVMVETVEASKDVDVKVAHKKSHSILSGVGSKVKHSISKVKKAITGKSSHSKQANKKPDEPSS